MRKWEYKIYGCNPDSATSEALNALDNDGWEIVTSLGRDSLIVRRPYIEGIDQLEGDRFWLLAKKSESTEPLTYEEQAYVQRWAPVVLAAMAKKQVEDQERER